VKKQIGGVAVVVTTDSRAEVEKRVAEAMCDVPKGRCIFVLWEVDNRWDLSVPVEAIAVQTVLGAPGERIANNWLFYGNGAVRLYLQQESGPSSVWMWVGFRREGEKAYRRKNNEVIDPSTLKASAIPVSHPVFTRDVANNLWHLQSSGGLSRIVRRLQSLTTWSDEVVLVHYKDRTVRQNHLSLNCDDDLVPVAEKIAYEYEGIELSQPGKPKLKVNSEEKLF